ncbi:MAG TPA: trypsin-like peptidase domain-containing protein [Polyangiaceae bacterium]
MGSALRRVAGALLLALTVAFGEGCCARPASAWEPAAFAWRESAPGIVIVVDRARGMAICTGTVVRSDPAGERFRAYVLTAKHCVDDDDHPARWGIAAPRRGDAHLPLGAGALSLVGVPVLEARRVVASTHSAKFAWAPVVTGATIEWDDDWAILAVDSPAAMPVVPLFSSDPETALAPGTPVTLVAYHDGAFRDAYGNWFLQSHEHSFSWAGVPPGVAQRGHSGAPIERGGEVVAILSGYRQNSNFCRVLCGSTWQARLVLVSVETIRRECAARGLTLSSRVFTPPAPQRQPSPVMRAPFGASSGAAGGPFLPR